MKEHKLNFLSHERMSHMKKILIKIIVFLIILILLIPVPIYVKDGGTIVYQAILYSVTNYHSLYPDDTNEKDHKILTGIEIKILGFTIYKNTRFES